MKRSSETKSATDNERSNDNTPKKRRNTTVASIVTSSQGDGSLTIRLQLRGHGKNGRKYYSCEPSTASPSPPSISGKEKPSNSEDAKQEGEASMSRNLQVSENIKLHNTDCPYYNWYRLKEAFLTDDDQVYKGLAASYLHEILEDGQFVSNFQIMLQAKNRTGNELKGAVLPFVERQGSSYDDLKVQALQRCTCPAAAGDDLVEVDAVKAETSAKSGESVK